MNNLSADFIVKKINLTLFAFFLLFPSACALKQRVVGVDNTFLEDVDVSKKIENLPFGHAWINPEFKKETFSSIYFKPVRTDLLPKGQWG